MHTNSPLSTPKWVLRCSEASISTGKISLLAFAETLLVLNAYIWLAFHYERQWWLLLSALAAPILLLRSDESKEMGLALANQYKDYWGVTTWREKILIVMLVIPFTVFMAYEQAIDLLYGHEGLELNWRAAGLGAVAFAFTVAFAATVTATIKGLVADAGLVLVAVATAIAVVSVGIGMGAGLIAGLIAGLVAVLIASAVTVAIGGGIASWIEKSTEYLLYIVIIPFMALGIWNRSLFIRVYATLHHPIAGLRRMPFNWRENLVVVDCTHLPELLPDAGRVDDIFTVKGLLSKLKSAENFGLRVAWSLIILLWYCPALLWRWSLKATLWLWWPLALLLSSPLEGLPADRVRDHAADRVYGLGRWHVGMALLVLLWLGISYWPELKPWVDTLDEKLHKPLTQMLTLTPPPPGLRLGALVLCCILTLMVGKQRERLKNIHKQVLDEEQTFHEQPYDRKDLFVDRTRRLERWYTSQVVAFIIFGYSVAIWLGHKYYPAETEKLISAWLLSYL